MWFAYQLEDISGVYDVSKLTGPFDTKAEAEAYCINKAMDGVIEVEPPE